MVVPLSGPGMDSGSHPYHGRMRSIEEVWHLIGPFREL